MRSRLGLKALGLCALLVGVMAITASAAQAEGEWDVGGKKLSTYSPALEPEVAGKLENKMGTLLTNVNGLNIGVLCTAGTLTGVKLKAGDKTSNGFVTFTGCNVWEVSGSTFVKELSCTVKTVGQANGTVQSEEGYGLVELHEDGSTVTLIIPLKEVEGKPLFGTIEFGACALPEEMPVYGKLDVKDCENKATVSQPIHLIEEHSLSALYAINTKHPVTLDGSAEVFLTGAHAGQSWAALGE